jgi:hypothetical protein
VIRRVYDVHLTIEVVGATAADDASIESSLAEIIDNEIAAHACGERWPGGEGPIALHDMPLTPDVRFVEEVES